MEPFIRTTSFGGFRELVTQLGQDPHPLLARFRIRPELLDDEDARVPFRSLIALLESAAEELHCADFGLRMSDYQNLAVLGPIALIARNAETVGHALTEIVRFIGYHSSGIQLDLDRSEPDAPRLVIELRMPGPQRQMVELAMGVAQSTMKLLCGPTFSARAVLLSGSSPLPLSRYRRHFGCETYLGQPCNALVITERQLAQRIERHEPAMHRALEQYLSQIHHLDSPDLLDQIRRLVQRLLPTQQCRLPLVAEQLGLHERTLQRQLAELGRTFEVLVEDIRRERADFYLVQRDIPMTQVAGMLGYSEQSVFNRACRRWFDMTPSARRRQLLEQRLTVE
ncbi:AraC family transcriptional regulator [Metapseudomonas lalkuanensis]|uniref:AraC family transcriptional regulator n=1 Tax=Metapseudomonas lalkuanensis TaxID=2604832 RepID=A0A5J6QQJ5_9GAMM|nr:AraC family transcriptional regulator [Pseudomonas lalkuanensis]QEY62919.1 AraC family transcriptional regulator [Pseudomonas lalkuanensis]UCO95861.1 AraC family transcriptional regulator [Pseudomonas lalkuanensis]